MNLPEIFNLNLFQILADVYGSDLERDNDKNTIGWSEIPYGMRKVALKKIYGIKNEMNMKMLLGQIMHDAFQHPEVLKLLMLQILNETDLKPQNLKIVPEYKLIYEINSEQSLKIKDSKIIEGHVDTDATIFSWELKTTWTYDKLWSKELAPYYITQLNGYLGSRNQKWGLVSCINMRAFINTFNSFKDSADKWTYNIPVLFNQKQFFLSVKKAGLIFKAIDDNDPCLECPVFEWECNYCDVRDQCGKEPIRCSFVDKKNNPCKKIMYEWIECLTDDFQKHPICQNCYENKTLKRKPYDEIKYNGRYYPYEVRYK